MFRRAVALVCLHLLLAVGALWGGQSMARAAETAELPEYQLKAAFIYNFARFITWPSNTFANSNSPIVLGVLGDDPFGPVLDQTLSGKLVGTHPIQIIRAERNTLMTNCHILFVARSEKERLIAVLKSFASLPVLTIGEFDRFAHEGGMINLFLEGKAVRFEINVNATERAGFKVSPKLGGLGKLVRGNVVQSGGER